MNNIEWGTLFLLPILLLGTLILIIGVNYYPFPVLVIFGTTITGLIMIEKGQKELESQTYY